MQDVTPDSPITSQGLEEKAKITLKFLKRKLDEYEEIKHQIKEIAKEAEKDDNIDFPNDDTLEALARIQ